MDEPSNKQLGGAEQFDALTPIDANNGVSDSEMQRLLETPLSPEDTYAACFKMYSPIVMNLIPQMSNKQLRRTLKYLIEYPLNSHDARLRCDVEKKMHLMADRIIQAKYGMIIHRNFQELPSPPGIDNGTEQQTEVEPQETGLDSPQQAD